MTSTSKSLTGQLKLSAVSKVARKTPKEPILKIKPVRFAQNQKRQLQELNQDNFYKKSYRGKACQNQQDDFLEFDLISQLPIRQPLAK